MAENGSAPPEKMTGEEILARSLHLVELIELDEVDKYLMQLAYTTAVQSNDPNCKVGACLVDTERKVVSVGYNRMPKGSEPMMHKGKETKNMYVCHAELNAISNSKSADMTGYTIYVTRVVCNECAKLIVESGIKKVIYLQHSKKWHNEYRTYRALDMMKNAGIKVCYSKDPTQRFNPNELYPEKKNN